jgi:TusA-related sulfurtransferase
MVDIVLDAQGKKCPMPVLLAKKELTKLESGQVLELVVDDKGALKDIPALVKKTGDTLLDTTEDGDVITFHIEKA